MYYIEVKKKKKKKKKKGMLKNIRKYFVNNSLD